MSTKFQSFLKNVRYVDVTDNEIISKYQINRNLKKLLANDILIYNACQSVLGSMNIKEYSDTATYQYGELVWFLLRNDDGKIDSLWMLRCIEDNNIKRPDAVRLKNGQLDFDRLSISGWKDENKYIDLVSAGIVNTVRQHINDRMVSHTSSDLHRFERLIPEHDNTLENESSSNNTSEQEFSSDSMSKKVLKNDLSNISPARKRYMFPYETRFMMQTSSILYGYARRYENGLLEYDIIFRLGFQGIQAIDGIQRTIIKANSQQINNTNSLQNTNPGWTGNERYFQNSSDYNIFKKQYQEQSIIGRAVQTNRGKYVNVYSANIDFIEEGQFRFADNKYMIFCSDIMSQDCDKSEHSINPSPNTMVFTNKSSRSVTAIYVTQPKNGVTNPANSGLVSNTYHCKIIGKSYL